VVRVIKQGVVIHKRVREGVGGEVPTVVVPTAVVPVSVIITIVVVPVSAPVVTVVVVPASSVTVGRHFQENEIKLG
jgi:hypothetical protein